MFKIKYIYEKKVKKYRSNWDTISLILINFGEQPTAKITCGTNGGLKRAVFKIKKILF